MPVKKIAVKKKVSEPKKITVGKSVPKTTRTAALSVPVYSLAGRESGTLSLPEEIFGVKINKKLLAQAVRIYSVNRKHLTGSTKTRGEVQGSTIKIYRQKGTGRARHGAVRAPIFVGGGIAFGPKPRKVRLNLPQKMKKAALFCALSSKISNKNVIGLSGIEKASGKTKEIANLLEKLKIKSALFMTSEKTEQLNRAVRNIPGVDVIPVNTLNAYEVLKHRVLMLSKESVEKLKI